MKSYVIKKLLNKSIFFISTLILLIVILGTTSAIIKPKEILNSKEYNERYFRALGSWGLQASPMMFNDYDDYIGKNEKTRQLRKENKEKAIKFRKMKFWYYTFFFTFSIIIFNLTNRLILSFIKIKKKSFIASLVTLTVFLCFLTIGAFKSVNLIEFRYYFIDNSLRLVLGSYLLSVTFIFPVVVLIFLFRWLYGNNLLLRLAAAYNPFLLFIIGSSILGIVLISYQDFVDVLYYQDNTFKKIRNISTIFGIALFFLLLKVVVNYSKLLKSLKNFLFFPLVTIFRLIIGSVAIYGLIFFSLVLNQIVNQKNTFYYLTRLEESFDRVLYDFPVTSIISIILIHLVIWIIIRLNKKQVGWLNPDDPWLPHNNIEPIPKEITQIIELSRSNGINSNNISEVSEMLDIGLEKMNNLIIKYEQLIELWQNQEHLSDQDWLDYGNKKGYGRHYEYSRFSVSTIKRIYKEELHKLVWINREVNKINLKVEVELGPEMAFQSIDSTVTTKALNNGKIEQQVFTLGNKKQLKDNSQNLQDDDFD